MPISYQHKIKPIEELKALIGPRPRKRKVAMCHGTFDVVHPGHIRHLMYAKEHGDIIIASLTCDEFIAKGDGRPYVPEALRAAHLAAIEPVDYVLVDPNPEPIKNILILEPDFFVKGFEYSLDGIHPKSKEEIVAIESYGGQFLFSPGDVVYSSTTLLAQHRPKLTIDKLLLLMESEGLTFAMLHETLNNLAGLTVHVVGDTIVDRYTYCSVLGPTAKRAAFSVKRDQSRVFIGGAGIVAEHMRGLGANVVLTTVLGDDELGAYVSQTLSTNGIRVHAVTEPHRPTIHKERFWASGQNLLQVDTVDNRPISFPFITQIAEHIAKEPADIVAFSDFRHGVFHGDSIPTLSKAMPEKAIRVADSQVANRWGNVLQFKNFDLLTPNEHEARFALGDQDSGIRHLGRMLYSEAKAHYVILKLGEKGTLTYRHTALKPRSFFHLDSFVEDLVDPLGAGDALLAAASLTLTRTQGIVQASILGAVAAALACQSEGNRPVSLQAMHKKLDAIEKST